MDLMDLLPIYIVNRKIWKKGIKFRDLFTIVKNTRLKIHQIKRQ